MYSESKKAEIQEFAKNIRIETLKQIAARGFGHLGGAMSIVDILAVLYGDELVHDPKNPKMQDRDRLICSKGHAGPSVYSTLALRGFFPVDELLTLNQPGTNLPSHCDMLKTKGIDVTTGSLGQGLSIGAGMAYGMKLKGVDKRVFVIVGDGELQEGQNWEAILMSPNKQIDNLVLFVDNNKMQLDGPTDQVNSLGNISAKFEAFNWNTLEIDGHNHDEIKEAISKAKECTGKPTVIICNTLKGKGVSWAETEWNHHISVSQEQVEEAVKALNA